MRKTTNAPYLPYEMLWEIFNHLWHSDIEPQERIAVMTSSLLVSHMWTDIFVHVAYRHAHIPCPSYLDAYLRIMSHESAVHRKYGSLPQTICRSLTIEVAPVPRRPMENVVAELLYKMRIISTHRKMDQLILRYSSAFPNEVFNIYQFVDMPSQVRHLELHMPSERLNTATYTRRPPWYLPNLRHLSVINSKGYEDLISNYIVHCPNLSTLHTDSPIPDVKSR